MIGQFFYKLTVIIKILLRAKSLNDLLQRDLLRRNNAMRKDGQV